MPKLSQDTAEIADANAAVRLSVSSAESSAASVEGRVIGGRRRNGSGERVSRGIASRAESRRDLR